MGQSDVRTRGWQGYFDQNFSAASTTRQCQSLRILGRNSDSALPRRKTTPAEH